MKNKLFIITLSILFLVSCNKSILDKQPMDMISDAVVWNDPTLIESFLAMQYALTTVMVNETRTYITSWGEGSPIDGSWNIENSVHAAGPLVINQIADEAKAGWNIVNVDGYKAGGLSVSGGLLEWWEYSYYIIRNLNKFVERVPTAPIDGTLARTRSAEARFLRAFNYFAMVKRYGGVPLITRELQLGDPESDLYPKRNSEQEIYDFIITEMDAIVGDLPESGVGRPSRYAALALKSRAALYAGSIAKYGQIQLDGLLGIPSDRASYYFEQAYLAANTIIQNSSHALYDDDADRVMNFKNIFMKKRNPEVIFAKQHNFIDALGGGGATWGYDFAQRPKPHAWNIGMANTPYLEMAETFEYTDGTAGTLDRAELQGKLWSLEELWGKKDPRFFATIYTMGTPWHGGIVDFHNGLIDGEGNLLESEHEIYEGVPAWGDQYIFSGDFGTGFGVMKYLDESLPIGSTWSNSGTDYIVFRYAEVLLNAAEAAVELGRNSEALGFVNDIRRRAGILELNSVDRDQVRHERRVELAFEGHRYWDVRRWRIAEQVLSTSNSGLRYILDFNTQKFKIQVLPEVDGNNKPRFDAKHYYFPITLTRTGANKNLQENPGY